MKTKLLTTVLIVLVAVGVVTAAEVINVDIKGYGSNMPYVGNGAYDVGPNTVWTVYYGGWGEPVGSARSEGLAASDQAGFCSVYAAQVWLGDDGVDHTYQYGSSLMDDGFVANTGATPKLDIFGDGAFQGIYDIYVYGRDAGSFTLNYYGTTTTKTVTGGVAAGTFVEGGNYVVFSNVDCNDASSGNIYINYTNKLNALQFVKKKSPVAVKDGTIIGAGRWDVAGDRNSRDTETTLFGPDTFSNPDPNIGSGVGYLDGQEFMGYDITVDDVNQGRYNIAIDVNTMGQYRCAGLRIYLDDKVLGDVNYWPKLDPPEGLTTTISANLVKGSHTVKWYFPTEYTNGGGMSTGYNIIYLKFTRTGSIAINNCNEVGLYGFNYPTDLNGDCVVDLYDLDLMVDNWLICNNPDPTKCF